MAEARKTTTKTTKTKTKTVPAKKPATKPAGKSVKPRVTKTVAAQTKTTKTTKSTARSGRTASSKTSKKQKNGAKTLMIVLIVIAALAVVTGIAACVINQCINGGTVMIENGNGDKIKAKRVGLEGYKYTIAVPTDFKQLSAEEIKANGYGTSEAPEAVYANADNTVNIVFSKPENSLANDQVEEYLNAMKVILGTSMTVISSESKEVDGHNVGVLKVVANADGEKVYNQMAFFSYDGKLTIISFNCKDAVRGEWEKAGENIINSLKIKK